MNLKDFHYVLPESRIAKHPPARRDEAKLLVYDKGQIRHSQFTGVLDHLPENALLVFNNTKVIPARIVLFKPTGARIEIFLLEPLAPSKVHEEVMLTQGRCKWKCLIGNAKKWKNDSVLHHPSLKFSAIRSGQDEVTFEWEGITFSELLDQIGKIPLPPYIQRELEEADKDRYQTVYSKLNGAVAAPTAGLHFTDEILQDLEKRGVPKTFVTLHISAGTFQPIKTDQIEQHVMHNEQVWVKRQTIQTLLESENTIAVGTTSMRTLESLYWFGVRLHNGLEDFNIRQEEPSQLKAISKQKALSHILDYMDRNKLEQIGGQTEIFLYPGYSFKMCQGVITNFHMPSTTLILLIAAFIGQDWRQVYQEALDGGYRFLSYGDSSLLIP